MYVCRHIAIVPEYVVGADVSLGSSGDDVGDAVAMHVAVHVAIGTAHAVPCGTCQHCADGWMHTAYGTSGD